MTLGQIITIYGYSTRTDEEPPNCRPTDEMLADRDRRYYGTPRTLTAWLMGDPPPGYSALERSKNDVAANHDHSPHGS